MNDCCEKCRFFRQPGMPTNPGECHRRAPAIQSNRYWPAVNRDDWCGEFEMREDVKPCMKCGQPSGVDGMGVMENYVIVGRVCKACSEKVKADKAPGPRDCVECGEEVGHEYIPFMCGTERKFIHHGCAMARQSRGETIFREIYQ